MSSLYDQFFVIIEKEDKEASVNFCLSLLKEKRLDVVTLYNDYLKQVLNAMASSKNQKLSIWKEHVRSGIVRTIIECCYPYVCEERATSEAGHTKGKVVVLCPDGEFHEIGARMVSDYFTLCGCESVFVGNSTPKEEFIDVIEQIRPDAIAIGVSNYYNLISAKRTIEVIKEKCTYPLKIFVGGHAFANNLQALESMKVDGYIESFEDVRKLVEGGIQDETSL